MQQSAEIKEDHEVQQLLLHNAAFLEIKIYWKAGIKGTHYTTFSYHCLHNFDVRFC